jgi:hypothetical protein
MPVNNAEFTHSKEGEHMKKVLAIVCAALTVAAASSWAQILAFPVKFKGQVSFSNDAGTGVTKLGVSDANLVTPGSGNKLLLVIDLFGHSLTLVEADANNGFVNTLLESSRLALLPDRSFSANTQSTLTVYTLEGPITVATGLLIDGKITPKSGTPKTANATVTGVLNDSAQEGAAEGDVTLKGKFTPAGTLISINVE